MYTHDVGHLDTLSASSLLCRRIFLIRNIQDDGKYERDAYRGINIEFRARETRKHVRSDISGIFAGVFKFPAGPTGDGRDSSGIIATPRRLLFRDREGLCEASAKSILL